MIATPQTMDTFGGMGKYTFRPCCRSPTTNFYIIQDHQEVSLPINLHPVNARLVAQDRIWVPRKYRPHHLRFRESTLVRNSDDFVEREGARLHIVSNASVHVAKGKVAGAWNMFKTHDARRRTATPLEHQRHAHSYRHEMETFYSALLDAETSLQFTHHITQYMDCKGGLKALQRPISRPKDTMETDMDIVLAYQQLRRQSKHRIDHAWVMGHAPEKKQKYISQVTPMEWENDDCDKAANAMADTDTAPSPFEPLPGYGAMLQIGGEWVTTHFRECVRFATTAPPMMAYAMKRLSITAEKFHSINWAAVGRVRSAHKTARQIRTRKNDV